MLLSYKVEPEEREAYNDGYNKGAEDKEQGWPPANQTPERHLKWWRTYQRGWTHGFDGKRSELEIKNWRLDNAQS